MECRHILVENLKILCEPCVPKMMPCIDEGRSVLVGNFRFQMLSIEKCSYERDYYKVIAATRIQFSLYLQLVSCISVIFISL